MSRPHEHDDVCRAAEARTGRACSRLVDVDTERPSKTDAYRIVAGQYGRRPEDRLRPVPRWWPVAFHAGRALAAGLAVSLASGVVNLALDGLRRWLGW